MPVRNVKEQRASSNTQQHSATPRDTPRHFATLRDTHRRASNRKTEPTSPISEKPGVVVGGGGGGAWATVVGVVVGVVVRGAWDVGRGTW